MDFDRSVYLNPLSDKDYGLLLHWLCGPITPFQLDTLPFHVM